METKLHTKPAPYRPAGTESFSAWLSPCLSPTATGFFGVDDLRVRIDFYPPRKRYISISYAELRPRCAGRHAEHSLCPYAARAVVPMPLQIKKLKKHE